MERRELNEMAFDHPFQTEEGTEMCHSTGYEVLMDDIWWNEYVDSSGNFHYGN